jgi:hypothetical protein
MKNIWDKVVEKIKTHFMFNNLFRRSCRLWHNVAKLGAHRGHRWRHNVVHTRFMQNKKGTREHSHAHTCPGRRTHTHTHKCVILIAFLLQQWFRERASLFRYSTLPVLLSLIKTLILNTGNVGTGRMVELCPILNSKNWLIFQIFPVIWF